MDQPDGHPCPECGAPRNTDRTPSCGCTRRASDALRDARTAEAAAAEDFDPLRIRPYVDLDGTSPDGLPEATKGTPSASGTPRAGTPGAHPEAAAPPAHATPPTAHDGTRAPEDQRTTPARARGEGPDAPDATMTLKAVSPATAAPGSTAPAPGAGGATDTGTAPHAGAAHTAGPAAEQYTSAPGSPQDPVGTTGSAATAPGAAGATDTGTAPHTGAAHTAGPAASAPGAEPHAGTAHTANTNTAATHHTSAQAGTAAPDATMALRAVRPGGAASGAPAAEDRTSVLPTPLAPGTASPNADDLGLFDDATRPLRAVPAGAAAPRPDAAAPRGRRRRGALIAASGAAVAVLGAAGWASGLFSYDTPSRDTAAPDDVRASVPDASSAAPSAEPSPDASSASPTASASDSPSASASTSGSPSPSASSSAPSASASASAEPSATPSGETLSSAPAVAPQPEEPVDAAPVLRRGDRGPEVAELQQRLRQLWLYRGDPDGRYSHRVEEAVRHYQWSRGINEELGVYGPQTRSRLETETRVP